MQECFACPDPRELEPATSRQVASIGPHEIAAELEALKCPGCGEVYVAADAIEGFERAVAEELRAAGATDGASCRYLRQVAGLSVQELAALLGVTPETVTRWERDAGSVDRSAWFTIGCLALDPGSRSALDAARSPRAPSATVTTTGEPDRDDRQS